MNLEYSPATGAPRILIQANPCWDQWAELAEAVWVTALEGGSNYWIDRVNYDDKFSIKSGTDLLKNFDVHVQHGADYWDDGEVTTGKSLDIVARGINSLPPDVKMSVMFPETCDIDSLLYWTRLRAPLFFAGLIDAEIADQVIQCGLFGSAVYG